MLALQRQSLILKRVEELGSVRTSDLAEELEVTVETIRRDLETLAVLGKVVRTHGGAISHAHPSRDVPFKERSVLRMKEKRAIAETVVQSIDERELVFFDASSTALQVAMRLPNVEMTVVTNAHDVISQVCDKPNIKVMGTGGVFDATSRSYIGPTVVQTLRRFHISKAFIGCNGVHAERGVSELTETQAAIKEQVVDLAERVFVLADHTKIGKCSSYFFCNLDRVTAVVTDAPERDKDVKVLKEAGLQMVHVSV